MTISDTPFSRCFDGVVEMELVVQTMSYINYELLIEWPWQ